MPDKTAADRPKRYLILAAPSGAAIKCPYYSNPQFDPHYDRQPEAGASDDAVTRGEASTRTCVCRSCAARVPLVSRDRHLHVAA